jgi:membrane glycosyltransferase
MRFVYCQTCKGMNDFDERLAAMTTECKHCGGELRVSLKFTNREVTAEDTKECPYCAETIQAKAIKCKHCGEWLDGSEHARATKIEQERKAHLPLSTQVPRGHTSWRGARRWIIMIVVLFLVLIAYVLSKQVVPPSGLAGFVRGAIVVAILLYAWNVTKK